MHHSRVLIANKFIHPGAYKTILCAIVFSLLYGCAPKLDRSAPAVMKGEWVEVDRLAPIDRMRLDSVSYRLLIKEKPDYRPVVMEFKPVYGSSATIYRSGKDIAVDSGEFCQLNPHNIRCAPGVVASMFLYGAVQVAVVAATPIILPVALIGSAFEDKQKKGEETDTKNKSAEKESEGKQAPDHKNIQPSASGFTQSVSAPKTTSTSLPASNPSADCKPVLSDSNTQYQEKLSAEMKSAVFDGKFSEKIDDSYISLLHDALNQTSRSSGQPKPAKTGFFESTPKVQSGLSKIFIVAMKSGGQMLTVCSRSIFQRDGLSRYFETCQSDSITQFHGVTTDNHPSIRTTLLELIRRLARTEAQVLRGEISLSESNAFREC